MTTTTDKPVGTSMHSFQEFFAKEHPSVKAVNAYTQHLADNLIGFATFAPRSSKDKDHVYTFKTEAGHQRIICQNESAPIYFTSDWESLKSSANIRLSKKPLNKAVLDKETAYVDMAFSELVETAKNFGVYDSAKDKTRSSLVRLCLEVEFGKDEVKRTLTKEEI